MFTKAAKTACACSVDIVLKINNTLSRVYKYPIAIIIMSAEWT